MTGSGHFFTRTIEFLKCVKMLNSMKKFGDSKIGTAEKQKAKEGGRKSIVANTDLIKGTIIEKSNIAFKRPGNVFLLIKLQNCLEKHC